MDVTRSYVWMLAFLAAVWGASYMFIKVALEDFSEGAIVCIRTALGAALLLAGGLRELLSDERAGLLAIRGRTVDVLAYTAFGLALVAVAVTID